MKTSERKQTIRYITLFSVLVTVVAWVGPLLGGSPEEPGLGFFIWGTAPLLVSLLMRAVTRDWSDLGVKPALRKNIGWYAFSITAYPIIMVGALVIGVIFNIITVSDFSMGNYLQVAVTALPIFLIFALFEEVGWRGYLAPKLATLGINQYVAAALLAVVWTAWHIPYLSELTWVYSSEDLIAFIPRYYLVLFAFAILYGKVRSITASFWPAVIMHGFTNAFGHPLAADYATVAPGQDYLGSVSTGLIMVIVTLLLGIAINQWHTRQTHPATSPA